MSARDCCFIDQNNWFRYRAGAIIVENGCILFVGSKSVDYYYTVGGGVHMSESSEDCIRREVLEETGIPYEVDHLAVVCENFFKGIGGNLDTLDCHCLEFYYIMKSRGSQELKGVSYDWEHNIEEMHWVPIEQLKDTNIKPVFLRDRLPEILRSDRVLHIVNVDQP